MQTPNPADVTVSEHDVPGGKEVDVTITVPTPACQVHPDTPVVPAVNPDAPPRRAGDVPGDVVVVSPGVDPGDATSAPTTDTPATVPAGQVDAGTSVARVDDPDKTMVPAGDLPPGVEVHNPDPAAPPIPGTGPVTAAELAAKLPPHDGEAATSAECQVIIDELAAAGFGLYRL